MFSALASRASRWSCPGRLFGCGLVGARICPRREFAQLDFANVVMIGIDLPAPTQPGTYDIELLALEFIGDRLQLTHVLVVFILLWCALVSLYLWMGIWQVARQWQRERPAWQELHESISGYKPTADFRRYNNFRDRATQCLDHTGLVLALVELLQQSVRPRLPFVVLELVASPGGPFHGPEPAPRSAGGICRAPKALHQRRHRVVGAGAAPVLLCSPPPPKST